MSSLSLVPKNAEMKLLAIHPCRGGSSRQYKQIDVHTMCNGDIGNMDPNEISKFVLFFLQSHLSEIGVEYEHTMAVCQFILITFCLKIVYMIKGSF